MAAHDNVFASTRCRRSTEAVSLQEYGRTEVSPGPSGFFSELQYDVVECQTCINLCVARRVYNQFLEEERSFDPFAYRFKYPGNYFVIIKHLVLRRPIHIRHGGSATDPC